MEPEGMVHALEEIPRLLRPMGVLVEIHPALEVPFLEVRSDGDISFSEGDPAFDYEDDLRHAEEALTAVVGRGTFVLDASLRFELRTHAPSLRELRDHWAIVGAYDPEEKPEELIRRRDDMHARAGEALLQSPGAEVVYVEPARMSRLTTRR
jgi:hypothetical protein